VSVWELVSVSELASEPARLTASASDASASVFEALASVSVLVVRASAWPQEPEC
jgi:hypothetical protein